MNENSGYGARLLNAMLTVYQDGAAVHYCFVDMKACLSAVRHRTMRPFKRISWRCCDAFQRARLFMVVVYCQRSCSDVLEVKVSPRKGVFSSPSVKLMSSIAPDFLLAAQKWHKITFIEHKHAVCTKSSRQRLLDRSLQLLVGIMQSC